ncbi:MAG TPA: carboxypeptidase regulatory-like domain-containing protein [Pyrinomonadaceae bacterium]|nr:carboxypeptidase regulatory-like domain-containing protein [Pyrinomonadaceae bacterium]
MKRNKVIPGLTFTRKRVANVLFLVLLFAFATQLPPAFAQQTVTSATLSGRVVDSDGACVCGAMVTVVHTETRRKETVITNENGDYKLSYLPVGEYQLVAECPGFAALNKPLTLTVGQALDFPIKLSVAGVTEDVSVSADVPTIEAARTQVAETILPREIDNLPLNGRNYLDLALLVPGVSRTNTGSNQRFAETSAVPGAGISVAGQRNMNNSFLVDGLSANDDAADLAGTFYSQDVIREFQVVTSGGIAEFGRASAGVVNILTRSGTNDWRGRFYGFMRNQRFDARNPIAPLKDPLTQAQYGASIGGPLQRDRSFLFSNFEQTRRNDSSVITISPSNVAAINTRLDQIGYRGPHIQTGLVPGGFDATNFFVRVDHQVNASNLLFARYSLYNITAVNSRSVGGLNAVSRGTDLDNRDHTIAAGNVTMLSSRTVNELRIQHTRNRLAAPVTDKTGPAVNISGVANFGTATVSPLARAIDLYEVVDNVSTHRGAHSVKGGINLLYDRVRVDFPGAIQGVYTFSSLSSFLNNSYSSFQQAFGAPDQFQLNPNLGLFIQDEWKPRSGLTINAGLRYDAQFLLRPINTDTNNFAPRIGIAYSPAGRKMVLRASFGIYYDRIPLRATSNALQRDGSKYLVVQFSPTQTGAPLFPNVLTAMPSNLATKPNITRIDPDIENGYSQQANIQIDRELPGEAAISVGYIHLRARHLILSRNINVPRLAASAGIPNLGRPDSQYGNIARYESSGDSSYDALVITLNKRASSWSNLRVSYTLSRSTDTAGNFFFSSPQNNFDLRDELGPSDNDQRHRLTVSGSLEAPGSGRAERLRRALKGFQLSYIFNYGSVLPFNILTGNDRNLDTNFNDRPLGVGRNAGRGFGSTTLDLRLSRKFQLTERVRLEAIAEGFNVFNRANFQVPNNVFGTGATPLPTFGRPTAASDPRQIQFGLRVNF